MSGLVRRRLRLPRHRGTTAHLGSTYPFQAGSGLGPNGVFLGTDVLAGGAGFAYDPFELYGDGTLTNPNMLFAGEPGVGKSAAAKTFIYRSVGVFGRWVAIADPKGEYLPLAEALGLTVVRLHPGGVDRLNPLDREVAANPTQSDAAAAHRAATVEALLGSVLRRELAPLEDAAVGWAVGLLARSRVTSPTLADLAAVLGDPPAELAQQARLQPAEFAREVSPVTYGLGKLLDRSLRGMFDGPTTVRLDPSGPGVVLDLSAVHHDREALTLVMIAATAWLQSVLAAPDGPRRIQVLDEAWCLLHSERTSRYLQACWKLCRAYGVANVAIVHRLSDLRSQADDGTAAAKMSMGLLADTQTRVLFRQSVDQVSDAQALLGLTGTEAQLLSRLCRGRALWKVGGGHTAVVQHLIGRQERVMCDSDSRMVAKAPGFSATEGCDVRN